MAFDVSFFPLFCLSSVCFVNGVTKSDLVPATLVGCTPSGVFALGMILRKKRKLAIDTKLQVLCMHSRRLFPRQ